MLALNAVFVVDYVILSGDHHDVFQDAIGFNDRGSRAALNVNENDNTAINKRIFSCNFPLYDES
jgi:hypothetical protein